MRLLQYLEIRNLKRFGDTQRIELDHPAVLIGPNNSGKTAAPQALALWSQAVRAWQEKKGQAPPKERTSTSLNLPADEIAGEVGVKLDVLGDLFPASRPEDET